MNNRVGTVTLTNSTVSGNSAYDEGGVRNDGTLTLTDSTVSGNSANRLGGGVANRVGTVILTNSTVSGNSAGSQGGGVDNRVGTVTLTNSTVSGNSAGSQGGGVYNRGGGTLTLTNSTVSGNSAGSQGSGVDNFSTLILNETLISGNAAPSGGPEVFNRRQNDVTADHFNLFGSGGDAGVAGFTPGDTDLVSSVARTVILDPTLRDNGGPTKTHALVAGSPAIDFVPAADCATPADQRGAPRPRDGDGDTVADCDIGAFEAGAVPPPPPPVEEQPVAAAPAAPQAPIPCTGRACRIPIICNLAQVSGTQCANRITLFVRKRDVRLSEGAPARAPKRIRFAAAITNVPSGQTLKVRLKLTKKGKDIAKQNKGKRLRGFLAIQNLVGTAVTNTPVTIRLK